MLVDGPPYLIKQPFLQLELDELFDNFQVREKYITVAKCVIRSALKKNSLLLKCSEIHTKASGVRFFLDMGYADYIFQIQSEKIPERVIVDNHLTKQLIFELVREFDLS